ncbi:MAG: heparinase II/III family protein [Spirochaetes bacterium]|nr:heparinase II/III family protein [Spirochaetota bacterium]
MDKRKLSRTLLAFGLMAAPLAAQATDFYAPANWKTETGSLEAVSVAGGKGIRVSGKTPSQASKFAKYLTFSIRLPSPLDLRGKQLRYLAEVSEPEKIVAHYVRLYNQGEDTPCWSHLNYASPFKKGPLSVAVHQDGAQKPMQWEGNRVNGREPGKVDRIQFWFGTPEADLAFSATVSALDAAAAPAHGEAAETRGIELEPGTGVSSASATSIRWTAVPEYADRPVVVAHPAGAIKAASLDRARQNMAQREWARRLFDRVRSNADFWMGLSEEEIARWIPAEDAWFKCLCPECGTQPEFAWNGPVLPDGKSIQCTKCQTVFPNDRYPEDRTYTIETPRGKVKTIRYYHGKDQLAQGENYGPRYHITGAVNFVKQRKLPAVYSAALVYALAGEKSYAEKVRQVLLRFADVYPDWSIKFRSTAYKSPRDNYMGGKLCEWKFHDGGMLPRLINAYDLTVGSGIYSDADRLKIENGILREYKWMITAFSPSKDSCLNAVPAHMYTAALVAAVLGDHELMDWVLLGKDGFTGFVERYFTRDGFWYETAPSYANMAIDPIVPLVMALSGYSDPGSYQGKDRYDRFDPFQRVPSLKAVFTGMVPAILPTGFLPAINDSSFSARASLGPAELVAASMGGEENARVLARVYAKSGASGGNELSLFLRDPKLDPEASVPAPERLTRSTVLPGAGWMILRRPETADRSALVLHYGGDVGGHTHNATLNTLYCDFGKEVVSDLGYLTWWHDLHQWLNASLAHNLVLVDGKPQHKARVGIPNLFAGQGQILAARVDASNCYPGTTREYARTVYAIPLPESRQYLVDFFAVKGGETHLWTFHADGNGFTAPQDLRQEEFDTRGLGGSGTGAAWLSEGKISSIGPGAQKFEWQYDPDTRTTLHFLSSRRQELLMAEAPGLRDPKTPYLKVPLHLLMARAAGPENVFTAVLEASQGKEGVLGAALLTLSPGSRKASAVKVETAAGVDLIVLAEPGTAPVKVKEYPALEFTGRSAVLRLAPSGKPRLLWIEGAGNLRYGEASLQGTEPLAGTILSVDAQRRAFTTDLAAAPPGFSLEGKHLLVEGENDGVYRLSGASQVGGRMVFQLDGEEVVRAKAGHRFSVPTWMEKAL